MPSQHLFSSQSPTMVNVLSTKTFPRNAFVSEISLVYSWSKQWRFPVSTAKEQGIGHRSVRCFHFETIIQLATVRKLIEIHREFPRYATFLFLFVPLKKSDLKWFKCNMPIFQLEFPFFRSDLNHRPRITGIDAQWKEDGSRSCT